MPKMKSNRGAKKRIKVTGSGKLVRRKSTARHMMSKKSNKRKRHLAGFVAVSSADEKRMQKLIG